MYFTVYKITNTINNKIYVGAHQTNDLTDNYMGSGTCIIKAIKKYGVANFNKIYIAIFDNVFEMFVMESEIVNIEFVSRSDTYNVTTGGQEGMAGKVAVLDKLGNEFLVDKDDPRYVSGTLISINKGKCVVRDKENNILHIACDDPRYISGEFTALSKGMIVVKDSNNLKFRVCVNDSRYLSGELVSVSVGNKHTESAKKLIRAAASKRQSGIGNSQYNTVWICNDKLTKIKKIKKVRLESWINKGWRRGRTLN